MADYSEVFVGIDTSKLRTVAIAEGGRNGEVRYLDEIGELTNELGSSGDAFSALAKQLAPVRWHRAMLTPLVSHLWSLRVLFRVAARQNRRRDRRVPAKARL